MTVRAVVFDVGNVLIEWDVRHLYRNLIPDGAEREAFLANVATLDWHAQHDAGRPFAETSAELIAAHPQEAAWIAAWGNRWLETIPGPIAGMPEIIADLVARDVPLYAITNFSGEFWKPFVAREAALFAPFCDIIVSGDEKLVKPDPAIYRLALRRFGLQDGEGVFIDDSLPNVVGAEENGFVGHHFADAATLRADLEQHGFL
ncbi:MAG: HAD family phosphatase [Sphingomonadales bacterium]